MATWVACIVETKGRADFWDVARRLDVRPAIDAVPLHVLIGCEIAFDFEASDRLAAAFSRELGAMAIGFAVQTTADVHLMRAYASGTCVRRMDYSRDEGGWTVVTGEPQSWERAYFFDEGTTESDSGQWPDLLADEIGDEERRRYEQAKRSGDATPVLALLDPSSTLPMWRVCAAFGIDANGEPAGTWKKPSLWSRLFAR